MKYKRFLFFIIFAIISSFIYYYEDNYSYATEVNSVVDGDFKVNFIDVGQGDSIFIEFPNDKTMLIDSGEVNKGEVVTSYVGSLGYSKIDYLVLTHPHTDHIGGAYDVINNFSIGEIYMPKVSSNSKTYYNLLSIIKDKGMSIKSAREGVVIDNNEELNIEILSPVKNEYSDLNNYSIVIKITYLDNSFLFMGDAETLVEEEITSDVNVDVIKVGHHGSSSSSSLDFVKRVSPKYAIISVGDDNIYNHPHDIIIDRYKNVGSIIYRTDKDSNIICISDGKDVSCNPKGEI